MATDADAERKAKAERAKKLVRYLALRQQYLQRCGCRG